MSDKKTMFEAQNIVIFSTADWDDKYWTNKQHTALALASLGCNVVYFESFGVRQPQLLERKDIQRSLKKLLNFTRQFIFGPKLGKMGVSVITPLQIPFGRGLSLIKILNNAIILLLLLRFVLPRFGKNYTIISYHPYLTRFNKIWNGQLIYHCVDDLSSVPGVDSSSFNKYEHTFASSCDAIFITHKSLRRKFSNLEDKLYFWGNVVDYRHFSDGSRFPKMSFSTRQNKFCARVIYHGALSAYKIDIGLLSQLAELRRDVNFVIVGDFPTKRDEVYFKDLINKENVSFLGYVAYERLPSLLSDMDVGLLIQNRNTYTENMFSMKFFEYIAAGLPVVSTQLSFLPDVKGYLATGQSASELSKAINKMLSAGKIPLLERIDLIGSNTYEERTRKMLDVINSNKIKHTAYGEKNG